MEKLKLIWSEVAIETFEEILYFYTSQKSKRKLFQKTLSNDNEGHSFVGACSEHWN